MDLSCNSELLTYARYNSDDNDVYEDSFVVLDRENDNSPVGQPSADELVAALQSASTSESSVESQPSMIRNANGPIMAGSEHEDDVEISMEMKQLLEENQELKKKVRDFIEKMQKMQEKFTEVGEILSNQKKIREDELVKLEESRKSIDELTKENTELKGRIVSLESEMTVLKEKSETSSQSVSESSIKNELEQKVAAKEEALRTTEEQLQGAQKRLEEVQELWNHERAQNAELKDKLRYSQARSDAAANGTEENMRALRTQVEEFQKKNVELNEKIVEKDDEIQILRGQLESSQLSLEEYRMAHEEKRAEIAALNDARSKILAEVETLHAALATKSAGFHELHQVIDEKERECATLRENLNLKDAELEEMKVTKRKTEDVCAKYEEKLVMLTEEMKVVQEAGEVASAQEVNQLRATVSKLDDENSALRTQVAALTTEHEDSSIWKQQCEVYQQDFERVLTEKEGLDKRVAELTEELRELQLKDQKLEKDLKELHQHHLRLAQEHVDRDSQAEVSAEGNENRSSDDIVGYLLNQVKRGVSFLWDDEGDGQQSAAASKSTNISTRNEETSSSSNPQAEVPQTSGSSEGRLPPCPVCGRSFKTLRELETHCGTCGESSINYGSHLDPFVFVPHQ